MSKTICRPVACLVAAVVFAAGVAHGADTPAKFLGANSCSSSSCHGGGGANQNQFLVWSLKDFHSHRPPATLTTARSKQIADALEIKDPTADARCTVCHAPLHEVSEALRGENFKISEGVSCESCHGPAKNWLRAHTRTDWTRADRTAAGMRDLQNLYVRANVCVACHQNVDADILKAGHPELIFELDGQSVAEPKHWRAEKNGNGAQAWLVGQSVALREMSWQLSRKEATHLPTENELNRCFGLFEILQIAGRITGNSDDKLLSYGQNASVYPDQSLIESLHQWSDQIARNAGAKEWSPSLTKECLTALAKEDFANSKDSPARLARRAERLVLALDRLVAALPELKNNEPVQSALNQLFKLAQSIPDFDPKQFADALQKFSAALANQP